MIKSTHKRILYTEAGYSLIGISLFMVVLGIFASAGITLKQKYDWAQRQEVTATNMALIKTALANYQSKNARLPCPTSLTTGIDTPTFGKEGNCAGALVSGTFQDTGRGGRAIRYGAVPVRTLGIPDKTMVDGWGHRYVYAVTEYYAGVSPDPYIDNGAISIVDANNTDVTKTAGNIIYTVVSPGADSRGAYTLAGVKVESCTAGNTNCVEAGGDGKLMVSVFRQYNTHTSTSNMDFTATMAYAASDVSYEWHDGPWGACSCCTHTQSRVATCNIKGTDTVVADSFCATSMKPKLSQSCAAFCWTGTPWVTQANCGNTTQKRTVKCTQNDGAPVPESLCKGIKLASERPWYAGDCCGGGGGGGGGDDTSFGFDRSGSPTTTYRDTTTGSMTTESGHNWERSCSGGSLVSDCGGSSCTVGSGADRDPRPLKTGEYFTDTGKLATLNQIGDGIEDHIGKADDLCVTSYTPKTKKTKTKTNSDSKTTPNPTGNSSQSNSSDTSGKGAYRDTDGDGKGDTFVPGGCTSCSTFRGGTLDKTGTMVTDGSNDNWKNGSNGGGSKSSSSSDSSSGTKTSSLPGGTYKNSSGDTIKVDSKGNATNTTTGKTYPSGSYTATVKK